MKRINAEFIKSYLQKHDLDKNNKAKNEGVFEIVNNHRLNTNLKNTFIKVAVIGKLYSADVQDINRMANHIYENGAELDSYLNSKSNKENIKAIKLIACNHGIKDWEDKKNKIRGDELDFYSFATKYCHTHSPESFPPYDSKVPQLLFEISKSNQKIQNGDEVILSKFFKNSICGIDNYENYRTKINRLISVLETDTTFNYREIDRALWIYAKELAEKKKS